MGKRQIGEMQPFEFVVTLIMADLSTPLIYGIVGLITLFLLHQILSLIEQAGNLPKRIISGTPSVVINKNGVDFYQLKKNNLGLEDLIESMRALGYFSLDDLDYAILESNGKLSAFESQKTDKPTSFPLLIVNDGRILNKNLDKIGETKESVDRFITGLGSKLKNTRVLTVDGTGRAYFQKKEEKFRIEKFPLKESKTW